MFCCCPNARLASIFCRPSETFLPADLTPVAVPLTASLRIGVSVNTFPVVATVPAIATGATVAIVPVSNPTLSLLPNLRTASSLPERPISWFVCVGPPSKKSPIVVIPSVATTASARPAAATCCAPKASFSPCVRSLVGLDFAAGRRVVGVCLETI